MPVIHICTLVYCWKRINEWQKDMKKWAFVQSQYINNLLKTQEDLHAFLAHRNKIHDRKQTLKRNKHSPEYIYLFFKLFITFTSHTGLITGHVRKFSPLQIFSEKYSVHLWTERGGNMYASERVVERSGMWKKRKGNNIIHF